MATLRKTPKKKTAKKSTKKATLRRVTPIKEEAKAAPKSREAQAKELISEKLVETFIDEDPSSNNKYLLWMAQQSASGQNKEDIIATVKSFHRRNKSLKHQDIYKYSDLKKLEHEILQLKPSKSERKELKNLTEGLDYVPLINKSPLEFYYVNSYRGCRNLGKDTNWCIAANSGYWNSYAKSSYVFILIDNNAASDNVYRKIAILNRRNYDVTASYAYKANDCTFNWENISTIDVYNDVINSMNLIQQILGGKVKSTTRTKTAQFKYDNDNTNTKDEKQNKLSLNSSIVGLAEEVKKRNLLKIMPFSNNRALLEKLKDDIIKYMSNKNGKIIPPKESSGVFYEVFTNHIDSSHMIDELKTGNHTKTKVMSLKKTIQALSEDDFAKLVNNIKRANVRKYILEANPKQWKAVEPDNVSSGIAYMLVKQHGVQAIAKGYKVFDKKSHSYWRRSTDCQYTKWVKARKDITEEIIDELLAIKDISPNFKKFLEAKKGKTLSKKDSEEFKKVIEVIAKKEGVSLKKLTSRQLKEYLDTIKD